MLRSVLHYHRAKTPIHGFIQRGDAINEAAGTSRRKCLSKRHRNNSGPERSKHMHIPHIKTNFLAVLDVTYINKPSLPAPRN